MMYKQILILLTIVVATNCMYYETLDAVSHLKTKEIFKVWHFLNAKTYELNSQEALNRYKNFKANFAYIKQRNSEQNDFQLGLGPFSDMTFEEFSKTMLTANEEMENTIKNLRADKINFDEMADGDELILNRKDSTDWSIYFGPARNQGSCGSCWAYGTTGPIEVAQAIKTNTTWTPLSTQQLVDCDTKNGGCNGGWYNNAFQHIINKGIQLESDYKYTAKRSTCKFNANKTLVRVKSYKSCCGCTESVYDSLLSLGPFATAVEANKDFMSYRSGIWTSSCTGGINHAVITVQKTSDYYKLRNSWGPTWGDKGYIKIKNNPANKNSCFVANYAFLPIL